MSLLSFFKWLNYPNEDPTKRKMPAVIENIPMLRRRELRTATDLRTVEDDLLFLDIVCTKEIDAIMRFQGDTSCRPNEILRLNIQDYDRYLSVSRSLGERQDR